MTILEEILSDMLETQENWKWMVQEHLGLSERELEGQKANLKALNSRCSFFLSGAFFTSVRLDILTFLQISRNFAWSVMSQVIYYLLVCYYAFAQVN